MLITIQYARAVAALLVVLDHLGGFELFRPLAFLRANGCGVDIFFVISGFIIWETSKVQSPHVFIWRRIARVVPAYWFFTSLLVAVALAFPQLAPKVHIDAESVLKSFLFVPYIDQRGLTNPLLLQGWSLNFEMYFYAVFAAILFIADRRLRLAMMAAFFLSSVLAGFLCPPFRSSIVAGFYSSPIVLEFLFGVGVNIVAARMKGADISGGLLFGIGAALLIWASHAGLDGNLRVLVYGFPAAITILGLVGLEDRLRRFRLPWLVAIGNASYSLYLCHPFVLSGLDAIGKFMVRHFALDAAVMAWSFAASSIILSVVAAHFSYRYLEQPITRFLIRFSQESWRTRTVIAAN